MRLGVRNRRADVRHGGRLLSLLLEAQVGRNGDRQQDADDDQDDEKLDQGEALVTSESLPKIEPVPSFPGYRSKLGAPSIGVLGRKRG
jgi:hypothetical protein